MIDLNSEDPITQEIIEAGCVSWEDLLRSVRIFKYGRNNNREDFNLVWYERQGTCSSKHAFLLDIARKSKIENVQLMLGIYLMTGENTPAIKEILDKNDLAGFPEAHCYLKVGNDYVDVTFANSAYEKYSADLLLEREITSEFVIKEKIKFHQEYLRKWNDETATGLDFETLWDIREACITALSEQ